VALLASLIPEACLMNIYSAAVLKPFNLPYGYRDAEKASRVSAVIRHMVHIDFQDF
jgi:hypothetical protein